MTTTALMRSLACACLFALTLSLAACGGDSTSGAGDESNPDTLRIALLPDEDASKVISDNEGLKRYLEEKTGKKIELHVLTSYAAMIEAMRNKRLEMAYFGPLSYCLCKQKAPSIEPFAAKLKRGQATYHAVVIGNKAKGIASIADIKGKKMGYGDVASTSSHLIPKSMLAQKGLREKADYEEHFLGKHDAVALNVQSGNLDAGGLSKPIFEGLISKGKVSKDKVTVIATSDAYPQYPWAMQGHLADDLKDKIRKAFYNLKDKSVLKPLKAEGFAPITDKDYDVIRNLATILGKDLQTLAQ